MSAIRKYAAEAVDNGLLAPELDAGISRVKSAKTQGIRTGNWLSQRQAQALLSAPDAPVFVLPTQFSETANLRDTIEFDRPAGGQISVLGIRFTPPGTLTTVPALTSGTGGGLAAHVASGNGWETTFVLVNLSATAQTAVLKVFDNFGNPLLLPLVS